MLTALQGLLWLVCWRGRWSARVLDALDTGGPAVVCGLSGVASVQHPDASNAFLNAVLSLTYTLLGRAVVVPSRGGRTLALGGSAVAVVGVSGALGRPVPAQLEAVVLRCLEKHPARRPQSAEALQALLLGCTDVPRWTEADASAWWAEHGARLRAHRDARRRSESGSDEVAWGRLTVAA